MAAPGAAFAGQPGRCAGHCHAAADPGKRSHAAGSDAARRLVRACLQPDAAIARARSGHRQRAGLAGAGSLPVSRLSELRITRAALDGLCIRLDGLPAAANTIIRKRTVFHGALGYAVELGLLPTNPISRMHWNVPKAAVAVSPATVASPAQIRAILAQAYCIGPELAAFFGCLYYAALRPEEAVALRRDDLILPEDGRGKTSSSSTATHSEPGATAPRAVTWP